MTVNEIRSAYLSFFGSHGHEILPSSSLLPENDPTTLFTGSGMQPMLPYLLGESHPKGSRFVDSQKCFRAQDIDEVGDNRHTTFFEMLGNWSLGDYFKDEQIPWMYSFLTKTIGLDPQNLYITCFRGDEARGIERDVESARLWQELFESHGIAAPIADFPKKNGMQDARIFYYDETKNWWSRTGVPDNMPDGEPGGPDTEMFWDFGLTGSDGNAYHIAAAYGEHCHVNCDCGRFLEIGNNVFMEYQKRPDGFVSLPQKNVDFGGGLERLAAASQNNPDVFMIDVFDQARETVERLSGASYEATNKQYAFRVILDHVRAATFLIGDSALPSNKDQGYFTRRLIRRAVRFGKQLGIEQLLCADVAKDFINAYAESYPELTRQESQIVKEMEKEEQKFRVTLAQGLKKFQELVERVGAIISGKDAFDLYQSYGFPIELTVELAQERGLEVDTKGFEKELAKHQDLSRQGAQKKFKGGLADHSDMSVKYHTATHLLHIALRRVLGDHVQQKGSNITPERLRFDFSHSEKLSQEQLEEVERLVNGAIARDYPVSWQEIPVKEANDQGVIGLFPDRYDELVKVYTVGDPTHPGRANPEDPTFSREICGGPHVEHTGTLGTFKITKEKACSAGIRRIRAILE
jgi:alanyl-tRNA synthetase